MYEVVLAAVVDLVGDDDDIAPPPERWVSVALLDPHPVGQSEFLQNLP